MNTKYIKMKFVLKTVCLLAVVLFAFSCGNADDDVSLDLDLEGLGKGKEVDKCLGLDKSDLVLSIQEQYTTLPGKVSILFKVSDADGAPLSGLEASQFTIYEQGRNDDCFNTISTSESQARISPNSQIFSNNAILVLDLSNSVLSTSLQELKTASISFIDNVMPTTAEGTFKMAIYWFDGEDDLHLLNELTNSKVDLISAVEGVTEDISNDPSTDLYGAVIKATDIASKLVSDTSSGGKISAASVIIFTDGTDQASRYTKESAQGKVDKANPNISFFYYWARIRN